MKKFRVKYELGETRPSGAWIGAEMSAMPEIVVHANNYGMVRSQVESMFGGPKKCRVGAITEIK